MESKGEHIEGSRYFRNFCCRCGEPLRVIETKRKDDDLFCEICSPKHKGCSSPPSAPLDDPDEHSSSWKIATGQGN